ncbi:MAG: hypothetical protein E7370_02660 [Clostridiales bacterium]|nr:hypothetical protein [Clostridiales bacterium]
MKILTLAPFKVNKGEVVKYLKIKGEISKELDELIDECIALATPYIGGKAVYKVFEVEVEGEFLHLGFAKVRSRDLLKNLQGCKKIALFAATVGAGIDRLILKYGKISPSKATVLQAIGSAAVEQICDWVNEEIVSQFGACKPRFSCGYGDLNLSLQRDIFAALSLEKNLAVTLSDNFFITPAKTVTAIVGIRS